MKESWGRIALTSATDAARRNNKTEAICTTLLPLKKNTLNPPTTMKGGL